MIDKSQSISSHTNSFHDDKKGIYKKPPKVLVSAKIIHEKSDLSHSLSSSEQP
jgi:hypothetical protein